jgi:hypothetical protein
MNLAMFGLKRNRAGHRRTGNPLFAQDHLWRGDSGRLAQGAILTAYFRYHSQRMGVNTFF